MRVTLLRPAAEKARGSFGPADEGRGVRIRTTDLTLPRPAARLLALPLVL